MDTAGRLVIPRALREQVGLRPGPVELEAEGNGVRIEAVADGDLGKTPEGRLVIPTSGAVLDDDQVWVLRHADQP